MSYYVYSLYANVTPRQELLVAKQQNNTGRQPQCYLDRIIHYIASEPVILSMPKESRADGDWIQTDGLSQARAQWR